MDDIRQAILDAARLTSRIKWRDQHQRVTSTVPTDADILTPVYEIELPSFVALTHSRLYLTEPAPPLRSAISLEGVLHRDGHYEAALRPGTPATPAADTTTLDIAKATPDQDRDTTEELRRRTGVAPLRLAACPGQAVLFALLHKNDPKLAELVWNRSLRTAQQQLAVLAERRRRLWAGLQRRRACDSLRALRQAAAAEPAPLGGGGPSAADDYYRTCVQGILRENPTVSTDKPALEWSGPAVDGKDVVYTVEGSKPYYVLPPAWWGSSNHVMNMTDLEVTRRQYGPKQTYKEQSLIKLAAPEKETPSEAVRATVHMKLSKDPIRGNEPEDNSVLGIAALQFDPGAENNLENKDSDENERLYRLPNYTENPPQEPLGMHVMWTEGRHVEGIVTQIKTPVMRNEKPVYYVVYADGDVEDLTWDELKERKAYYLKATPSELTMSRAEIVQLCPGQPAVVPQFYATPQCPLREAAGGGYGVRFHLEDLLRRLRQLSGTEALRHRGERLLAATPAEQAELRSFADAVQQQLRCGEPAEPAAEPAERTQRELDRQARIVSQLQSAPRLRKGLHRLRQEQLGVVQHLRSIARQLHESGDQAELYQCDGLSYSLYQQAGMGPLDTFHAARMLEALTGGVGAAGGLATHHARPLPALSEAHFGLAWKGGRAPLRGAFEGGEYDAPASIDVPLAAAGGAGGAAHYRLYCIVYHRLATSGGGLLDSLCLFRVGKRWYEYDAYRSERPMVERRGATTQTLLDETKTRAELYLYSSRSEAATQTQFLAPVAGWAGRCLRVPDAPLCGGELYLTPTEAATVLAAPPLGQSTVHSWRRPAADHDRPLSGTDLLRQRVLRWRRRPPRSGGGRRPWMAQLRSAAEALPPERRRAAHLLLRDYPKSRDVAELQQAYELLPEAPELAALRQLLQWLIAKHLWKGEAACSKELLHWYGETQSPVTTPQRSCIVHHAHTHHLAMAPPHVDAGGAMVVALRREVGFPATLTDHEKMALQVQLSISQLLRARCVLYDPQGQRQIVEVTAEPGWWEKHGPALLGFVALLRTLCDRDKVGVTRLLRRWENEGVDYPQGMDASDQVIPYGDGQLHATCLRSGRPLVRQEPAGTPGAAYRIAYISPHPQHNTPLNAVEVVWYNKDSYFGAAPS